MEAWISLQKDFSMAALVKSGKATASEISAAWKELHASYITEFGINDHYKKYLLKINEYGYAQLDVIIRDDSFSKIQVKRKEEELRNFGKKEETGDFGLHYAEVEIFVGWPLDPKKTTVYKFYNYDRLRIHKIQERMAVAKANGTK